VKEPIWLRKDVVLAVQERLLAEHGGSAGVRDDALLESALGRPQNLFAYGKPTLFDLAATYAHGIINNHPFIDGNKRAGFMAAFLFLGRNGFDLVADEEDAYEQTLAVAEGTLDEKAYAKWLKENCRKIK
jgi:death-on-curing protein